MRLSKQSTKDAIYWQRRAAFWHALAMQVRDEMPEAAARNQSLYMRDWSSCSRAARAAYALARGHMGIEEQVS